MLFNHLGLLRWKRFFKNYWSSFGAFEKLNNFRSSWTIFFIMISFTNEAGVLRFALGTVLGMRFGFWLWSAGFGFTFSLLLSFGGFFRRISLNDVNLCNFSKIGRGGRSRIIRWIGLLLPIRRFFQILRHETNNTIHHRGRWSFRGSRLWSIRQNIIKRAGLRVYQI